MKQKRIEKLKKQLTEYLEENTPENIGLPLDDSSLYEWPTTDVEYVLKGLDHFGYKIVKA